MGLYVDADVVIWHLRRLPEARRLIGKIAHDESNDLWIGAIQRAEIVFCMRPREEAETQGLLSLFRTQPVNEEIVYLGGVLNRQWHPAHGVGMNDALLAASAILTGGKIITQNMKHFPMPEVVVESGGG